MSSPILTASQTAPLPPVCEAAARRYRFANIEVDFRAAELRRSGIRIRIQDQPLHLLAVLLSRPGELVTREELRQVLWTANTFVDFDHSLNSAVKRLRDVLNDSPDHPRLIETVPRHGYRFIAPVSEIEPSQQGVGGITDRTDGSLKVRSDARSVFAANPENHQGSRHRWSLVLVAVAAIITVLVATAILAALVASRARARSHSQHGPYTLAVSPFHDLSEQQAGRSLSEGITQELITQLGKDASRVALLAHEVGGQNSSAGTTRMEAIGGSGADYVLEGSVRVHATDTRIAVQLIRVRDSQIVWTDAYDQSSSNVLQSQTRVAEAIIEGVCEQLRRRETAPH